MTEVKPLSDCRNAYEDFPDLAEAVEYLANNAGYIPLSQWHKFNDALNATIAALKSENEKLRGALEWYEHCTARCCKITSDGEDARWELDQDRGQRARAALAKG